MATAEQLRKAAIVIPISILLTLGGWAASCSASDIAALTVMEQKWLTAADPVLQFAVAQGLPIDVIVRPAGSDEVPFSVAVQDDRCKLILAMRDRSDVEAPLAGVPTSRHGLLIEAMAAHEMAHCWRYMHGMWNTLPSGINEPLSFAGTDNITAQRRTMRSVQSEEAYADLVALAWTQWRHPDRYQEVHAWLVRVRDEQPAQGSFHDTRVWLALAQEVSVFAGPLNPFEQVQELWVVGLRSTANDL